MNEEWDWGTNKMHRNFQDKTHISGVVCQYDAEGWHDGGGISLTGWGVFLSFCIGCDGVWWGWVGGTGALWGPW